MARSLANNITGTDPRPIQSVDEIDPLDIIGKRTTPGTFLANLYSTLGKPSWYLEDTSLASSGTIPDMITVRNYLTMIGNVARHGPDPSYFIDYAVSGVPLYLGALDMGMRYAPNLRAALDLLVKYANGRPGYHSHRILEGDGLTTLELVPMTNLGAGRSIVVETPILVYHLLAVHCAGEPVPDAVVELRHGPPRYEKRLRSALGCELRFNAGRDAIAFPTPLCRRPSVAYDPDLWRAALLRCHEESENRKGPEGLSRIRAIVVKMMAENGSPPCLREVADRLGLSGRTLIRRLKAEGQTFQALTDDLLREKCILMLADPNLTIARISEELGYSDASGFHRSFRRWFNSTPDEYRRKLRSAA